MKIYEKEPAVVEDIEESEEEEDKEEQFPGRFGLIWFRGFRGEEI
jgi:hypothetical protein